MGAREYFKNPSVYFRIAEWIFALIAFATCASLNNTVWADVTGNNGQEVEQDTKSYTSYEGFMIFTGVTGWVWSMVFLICYGIKRVQGPKFNLFELVINFVWWVFFLSASIAMAAKIDAGCGTFVINDITTDSTAEWCNTYKASIAFGFLSFFGFVVNFVISLIFVMKPNRSPYYATSGQVQMGQV